MSSKENLEKILDTKEKKKHKKLDKAMPHGPLRSFLSGISLALVATLCIAFILFAEVSTSKAIAKNQRNSINSQITALLPEEAAADGVNITCYKIKEDRYIGHNQTLFVAKRDTKILGYVMTYSTSLGYSNPLVMIAGFDANKNVYKADIQFSQETPGLGDKVDRKHGNFLDQFNGKNLKKTKWDVKKFGGDFDFITGSTVTSRATVIATSEALKALNEIDIKRLNKCKVEK